MSIMDQVSVQALYDGVGIIYDDELNGEEPGADVFGIVEQIESRGIPLVKRVDIPEHPEEVVRHLREVSFVILDWDFCPANPDMVNGVHLGDFLKERNQEMLLDFLESLVKGTYCPIFIFSKESPDGIEAILKTKFSQARLSLKRVFVCHKKDLVDGNLFSEIEAWLRENLAVYVMKKWERDHSVARTALFNDFETISPVWPKILWDCFSEDGVSPSDGISKVILNNLHAFLPPIEFSREIFENTKGTESDPKEIRNVLSRERFLAKDFLSEQNVSPGDLFSDGKRIWVNIRPACDCIPRGGGSGEIDLYLLPGSRLSRNKEKQLFDRQYGHFSELECQAIVFSLHEGRSYDFRFKDLMVVPWSEFKDQRIGRLLPPFITRIQQRYAAYLQREGLPRIPQNAIVDAQ